MERQVIVALDFASGKEALDFLGLFTQSGRKPFVKIGMELFYAEGPEIVRKAKTMGHKVFLDLKVHDIPNTARRAMASVAAIGADIVNVHAAGGSAMMKAALEGLSEGAGAGRKPLLIAVTQLTSTDAATLRDELLISRPMEETVLSYARLAAASGLAGVVCSPLEAPAVKTACGNGFLAVTPGVRFADGEVGDQKRVATPADAARLGSDMIVMGRPITRAADPAAAYARACAEFGVP